MVKGFRECGLVVRKKWVYIGVLAKAPFRGKCLTWMTFHPEEASKKLRPLDACHMGKLREREPPILIHSGKAERGKGEEQNKEFCPGMKMVQQTHSE